LPRSAVQTVRLDCSSAPVEHKFDLHYKRGRVLGSGGYSTAVEAFSRIHPGKKVAAKITQKGNLSEEDLLSIESEIVLLKEIDHPNVVKYIDNFEDSENFYVCLELLEGGELFDRIVEKSQYDEGEARDLFVTIIRAIKYLHDRNIVHRDLKPENLLMSNMDDDTAVKIADFGFAKKADGLNLTTQCGSPGYVAPEILKKKKYGIYFYRVNPLWCNTLSP
jgi:serine/threonine protein kinase